MTRQRTDTGGEGRGDDAKTPILIYAPEQGVLRWIEHELFGEPVSVTRAISIAEVVTMLRTGPAPRARILIADFDVMTAADTLQLPQIREAWFGMIIALGNVSDELHRSLAIDHVLTRPLGSEVLRTALTQGSWDRTTARIRKVER